MKNTKKTGFTLIELLVVIVIIGILATISVATFGNYISDSREAVLKNSISELSTQIKLQAIEASLSASILGGDGIDYGSISAMNIITNQGISFSDGNICYGSGDGGFVISGHLSVAEGVKPTFFTKGTPAGIAAFDEMNTTEKEDCDFSGNLDFTVEEKISFDENGIATLAESSGGTVSYCTICNSSCIEVNSSTGEQTTIGPGWIEECAEAPDCGTGDPCYTR